MFFFFFFDPTVSHLVSHRAYNPDLRAAGHNHSMGGPKLKKVKTSRLRHWYKVQFSEIRLCVSLRVAEIVRS
jgi:hypothetical protein